MSRCTQKERRKERKRDRIYYSGAWGLGWKAVPSAARGRCSTTTLGVHTRQLAPSSTCLRGWGLRQSPAQGGRWHLQGGSAGQGGRLSSHVRASHALCSPPTLDRYRHQTTFTNHLCIACTVLPCVPIRYPAEYQQLLVDMREMVQAARARNAWAEALLAPVPAPAATASSTTRSSSSSSSSNYAAASSRSRTSTSFPLWSDDTPADDTLSPDDAGFPFMFTATTGRRVRDPYRIQALGMQQGGSVAAAAGLPPGALQGVQQALENPTTGRVRMGITMNFIFIDGNQV